MVTGTDSDPHKDIHIKTPRLDALPLLDISFTPLFQCLSSDHITCLLHWILVEGKILLVSERPCLLTHIAELLKSMILPFEWNNVYIPLCPDYMKGFIRTILPFLIGRTTNSISEKDMKELEDDVMVCNLDLDDIIVKGEKWSIPEPYDHVWTPLCARLEKARGNVSSFFSSLKGFYL